MADSFKTPGRARTNGGHMAPTFNLIGLVVTDMPAALAFYRRLGQHIPAAADTEPPHWHRVARAPRPPARMAPTGRGAR
jgi:catechol 2,3-dioxygenase-like lactoylglutathione lyase family enzyme